jgi:hypothetical protein
MMRRLRVLPLSLVIIVLWASVGMADNPTVDAGGSRQSSSESLILVIGAGGNEQFEEEFSDWAVRWEELAQSRQWDVTRIEQPTSDGTTPREQLRQAVREQATGDSRCWIVMLGHGTYLRGVAKFNLIGPDVAAGELKSWLDETTRPLVLLHCFSASAPFLTELSAPGRIVVSATRSGNELNFSRFGRYLSEAISEPAADLDHDREISVLEAFLYASAKTQEFYDDDSRLSTEHALIDDNGDGKGTSRQFYRGILPVGNPESGQEIDGAIAKTCILRSLSGAIQLNAEESRQRQELEDAIAELRGQKPELDEKRYLNRLESLLIELSQLYDHAESR